MSLGATQSEAESAVYKAEQILGEEADLEAIIKQALKVLGEGK
jgi:Holliday junction resolvasome RuvABC DNA-binding subunit